MTEPGVANPAGPEVLDLVGCRATPRARRAETLAQLVLGDAALAAPLRLLVREAALATGAENAQISIVSTRQIAIVAEPGAHPSPGGPAPRGATTSLEDTVCAVSVRADAPLCIPDARLDDRVASLPAVADGIVGAYLGSPLRMDDASVIGVLCVYDAGPHEWTREGQDALDEIAGRVSAALTRLDAEATPAEVPTADRAAS